MLGALKKLGLFKGSKSHPMSVPVCSRSGDVIEMLLKPQWFIDTKDMARRALEAGRNELVFHPESHAKTWNRWLEENRFVTFII